jgi:hypothetical protein
MHSNSGAEKSTPLSFETLSMKSCFVTSSLSPNIFENACSELYPYKDIHVQIHLNPSTSKLPSGILH